MPRTTVIIGAGIAGLSTALELARLGHEDITIIDQFGPGFGSSSKSAGVVETQYLDSSGIRVRDYGLRYFEDFAEQYGTTLTRSGYLRLGATSEDLEIFQQSVDIQRQFGIKDPVVLDAKEIESRWPRVIMQGRAGGLFGPSDGHVDSYEFCLRAAAVLVSKGVRLMNGVKILGALPLSRGGWTLHTTAGSLDADSVVNAAGPWAQRVAALFGADMPQNNQLRPKVKFHHQEPLEKLVPFVMDYVPGSGADGIYFRSETPHELFVGIHTDESILEEQDPEGALGEAPREFIDRVMELLPVRLQIPNGMALARSWTGFYAISPDNKPIVDFHPAAPDVVHVMGAGGSGIQLAPAMARVAAELVHCKETNTFPDTNWALSRFVTAASN